jgi:NADH:ubiquinone oxidoreductase subunit 4 (subunit M)
MIFSGVFDTALTNPAQLVVAVVAVIMTPLTLGYSFWTVRRVFYGPLAEGMGEVKEAELQYLLPLAVLALIAVIIGVYPRLVTDYLAPFFGLH